MVAISRCAYAAGAAVGRDQINENFGRKLLGGRIRINRGFGPSAYRSAARNGELGRFRPGNGGEFSVRRYLVGRCPVRERKVLWSACCEQMFASSGLQDLWQHSRKVAAVAHGLAAACQSDQESAYVAGLLHDIGRLLLWTAPAERKIAEETLHRNGFPLVYAETLLYGADHAGLGGRLLQRWAIPSHIAEAVRWHHRPESTDSKLAAILCLAENSVRDESEQEHLCPILRRLAAARILGLDSTDLQRLNQKSSILAIESCA